MEVFERFVFNKGLLYPGAIKPDSVQLKNIKMLLHERDGFNMNRIRKIAKLHPNSIWDPEKADYGSLVDSIMLGFTYVTIDGWIDVSKLKISHALCKNAITKFTLNKSIERIIERLDALKNEIQRPILIIGSEPGDIQQFFDIINPKLAKFYDWYIAPSSSNEILSNSYIKIKGWCKSSQGVII
ncbi:MAG: hypothetical protein CMA03_02365 [Euryarchaeota archaeon]|nr:hypothetical protein [Euryarchaeota archaeon]|tara:strand:+ start:770 stop:1321 length:552 start_codon:yes stop_codon:yes gene_type:complete